MSPKEPTIAAILQALSDELSQPISEQDLCAQVLTRRPSKAKHPCASIRDQLRYHTASVGWVRLENGNLLPLRLALQGTRFRIELDAAMATSGLVPLSLFAPFIGSFVSLKDIRLVDANAAPISYAIQEEPQEGYSIIIERSVDIQAWLKKQRVQASDSILVQIMAVKPLTLELVHEPASHSQVAQKAQEDAAFVEGLVQRVSKSDAPISAHDAVLSLVASASWRTAYPGRTWQQLVIEEPRLTLIESFLLADASYRSPFDRILDQMLGRDTSLLETIQSLQQEMRSSRRTAVERGLWNGIAPRVSTARTVFDMMQGTAETIYLGEINAIDDHSADIEEHLAHGMYSDTEWSDDADDALLDESIDLDDENLDLDEIEDMDQFFEEHPALNDATRRLMSVLSDESIERIQQANSPEEIHEVLAEHLAQLLQRDPSLFVPLELDMIGQYDETQSAAPRGFPDALLHQVRFSDMFSDRSLERQGQLYESPSTHGFEHLDIDDDDEEQLQVELALERSNALMNNFYEAQRAAGKSEQTAANRTRDLWLYADFLANYYGRSLDQGDYATLDECLFFYFPRKVANTSQRWARDLCTSMKQFYSWLKQKQTIQDDGFAQALWQRREQLGRVVDLYQQIDAESPNFYRLFAHLFAPYTA